MKRHISPLPVESPHISDFLLEPRVFLSSVIRMCPCTLNHPWLGYLSTLKSIIDAHIVKKGEFSVLELGRQCLSDSLVPEVSQWLLWRRNKTSISSVLPFSNVEMIWNEIPSSLWVSYCWTSSHERSNQGVNWLQFGSFPLCGLLVKADEETEIKVGIIVTRWRSHTDKK